MTLTRKIRRILLSALGVYTLLIAAVDFFVSSRAARYFLTDITSSSPDYGHLPLYAVNTSLSVFLLWAGAVLFLMAWRCLRQEEIGGREEAFLVSQMLIFFYLGCDDRFLVHEGLSDQLGFKEWIFFGVMGSLEAFFLLYFGKIFGRSRKVLIDVVLAGFFFSIMFMVDIVVPYNVRMHLSAEDLAKLWSAVFLFKFAWDTCSEKIEKMKGLQRENP
jgi:hypothetical protein